MGKKLLGKLTHWFMPYLYMANNMYNRYVSFEWDENKNEENIRKHGISFEVAQKVFADKTCVMLIDDQHSDTERRYLCIGEVKKEIITVRFTMRKRTIRIFGAGAWRKGRKIYETQNEGNRIH
jgi:uncharacterized DUF497 family protein